MAVRIVVRNYADLCFAEYHIAYQEALRLYLDMLSLVRAAMVNGMDPEHIRSLMKR